MQAISLKETQLIGNVSLFPVINKEDSSPEIRIISPKSSFGTDAMKSEILDPQHAEVCDEHDLDSVEHETRVFYNHGEEITTSARVSDGMMSNLRAISSYEDFLKNLDEQLRQVESDICKFFKIFEDDIRKQAERDKTQKCNKLPKF
ncbi:hypothetical protein KSP40_PGU006558 [Platanthera guangdongensis]|uniref:Uncharacterized protein n=1 Tax=Platanthera guangdongensis TaxID=2320717 RepID=A0ABR2LDM1_9ASPA